MTLWTLEAYSTWEIPGVCDAIGVEAHVYVPNADVEPHFDKGQFGELLDVFGDTDSCTWVIRSGASP